MIGKYSVLVENRSVQFKFEIERNISIIRGDSGTGKTSLISLIANYQSQGKASGVRLVCDKRCVAMVGLGDAWRNYLDDITDSIIFIDEGERYVASEEFAECIEHSDNYFVIATRNNLYNIPYSVDAIYEVKTSGRKYGELGKTYNSIKKMYGDKLKGEYSLSQNDKVIVEDIRSKY
ncbi:ATP-binding protein [Butyrivibrio sp. AD3002]|uniref:ATP-binding protein n=1 Tax=Butyrivibrio sp. AD3002 TaxID=1280670 RepID=UPI0003B6C9B6|nr:ATP-binding protein [Butyrivibrio sp. AD3002]